MIHWLLKTALLLAGFYAFFMLFMRTTTLFRLNRAVLLSGTAACLLLPTVRINVDIPPAAVFPPLQIFLPATAVGVENAAETAAYGPDWKMLAHSAYAAGFAAVIISSAVSSARIRKTIRRYKGMRYCYNGKRHVMLHVSEKDMPSFSFMNHVVISRNDYENHPEILLHECTHAGRRHSADMLFMSIVCALYWFNPLVWIMRSEIRMMHEYEADEAVLKQGIDATKYQLLLVRKAVGDNRFLIASSFSHSKIKNRITMMKKNKTSKRAALAYIACLPLLLAAMSFTPADSGKGPMPGDDKVYEYSRLETPPMFNGDNTGREFAKWLSTELDFPEAAADKDIEGRVLVQFRINSDGSVSDVSVLKGVHESIDSEAIRAVSESPDWTPGYIGGRPVSTTHCIPVLFSTKKTSGGR